MKFGYDIQITLKSKNEQWKLKYHLFSDLMYQTLPMYLRVMLDGFNLVAMFNLGNQIVFSNLIHKWLFSVVFDIDQFHM